MNTKITGSLPSTGKISWSLKRSNLPRMRLWFRCPRLLLCRKKVRRSRQPTAKGWTNPTMTTTMKMPRTSVSFHRTRRKLLVRPTCKLRVPSIRSPERVWQLQTCPSICASNSWIRSGQRNTRNSRTSRRIPTSSATTRLLRTFPSSRRRPSTGTPAFPQAHQRSVQRKPMHKLQSSHRLLPLLRLFPCHPHRRLRLHHLVQATNHRTNATEQTKLLLMPVAAAVTLLRPRKSIAALHRCWRR
mmetsp:Transcript_21759/g.61928  ORF Transcript_21759/g.61928 Transcript_21759/m.61928 type:complete len:243 (-) Transcript_21759:534-1262(-)